MTKHRKLLLRITRRFQCDISTPENNSKTKWFFITTVKSTLYEKLCFFIQTFPTNTSRNQCFITVRYSIYAYGQFSLRTKYILILFHYSQVHSTVQHILQNYPEYDINNLYIPIQLVHIPDSLRSLYLNIALYISCYFKCYYKKPY